MNASGVCRVRLLLLLVGLLLSLSAAEKRARGYRGYRRKDVTASHRSLKKNDFPTMSPTFAPSMLDAKELQKEEEREEEDVADGLAEALEDKNDKDDKAVSYTHLTLPTICSV